MVEPLTGHYRPDIDGLRAIAVICVIVGHAFPNLLPGGFVGVDLFFVISGYLINGIILRELAQGRFSFGRFYAHRCRRIMPALTVVLVAVLTAGLVFAYDYHDLGLQIAAGFLYLSNILLWSETGYFDYAAEFKPLLHLWSLGVEEQFYLTWPILLVIWHKQRWRVGALVGALALLSFWFNAYRIDVAEADSFYLLPGRYWELLAGAALAYVEQAHPQNKNKFGDLKAICALVLLCASQVFLTRVSAFPGYWALLPVGAAVLFISAGPGTWVNKRILSSRLAVFLGRISYPLYLWHWPLLSFYFISADQIPYDANLVKSGLLLAAFFLAWGTWKWIETPARARWFPDGWLQLNVGKALAASLATIATGGVVGTLAMQGVFTSPEKKLSAFTQTYKSYPAYFSKIIRAGKCQIDKYSDVLFDPSCYETHTSKAVALWGDSHAAQLYPGLRRYLGDDVSVMQFSRYCPPFFHYENSNLEPRVKDICRKSGEFVRDVLAKTKPQVLVLAALWSNHYVESDTRFFANLNATIEEAKSLGVKHVIVVGQVPKWSGMLHKVISGNFLEVGKDIPRRTMLGVDDDAWLQDDFKRNIDASAATYLPLKDYLCNQNGCLVLVGNNPMSDLFSFDNGHLTENASKYVAAEYIGPVIDGFLNGL